MLWEDGKKNIYIKKEINYLIKNAWLRFLEPLQEWPLSEMENTPIANMAS